MSSTWERPAAYHDYVPDRPVRFLNRLPVAPRTTQRTRDIYSGDISGKGVWILHTLRYLIGRDPLLVALRRMSSEHLRTRPETPR